MDSLASWEDLVQRMPDADMEQALAALDDASAVVRAEGGRTWSDPATAPQIARTITLRLAIQTLRNPQAFQSETVGPYSYRIADGFIGSLVTDNDRRLLTRAAGGGGLISVPVQRDVIVTDIQFAYDQNYPFSDAIVYGPDDQSGY